jgi:hypothetical protein
MRRYRRVAGLLATLLLAGCQASPAPAVVVPTPEVVVAPRIAAGWTAAAVTQRALADIALTERQLGRVLAPARILRVVRLPPGAEYHLRKPQGIAYLGTGWNDEDPTWMVEAVGTFASFGVPGEDGPVNAAGTHGYFTYIEERGVTVGDAGGSGGFFPCWFRYPQPEDTPMEGTCDPTSGGSPSTFALPTLTPAPTVAVPP